VQERFKELKEIPWMAGLRQLPDRIVPAAAALAGVVEELFFRGVVIFILIDRFGVRPVAAAVIAGILFCLEQLVQLQTSFQMLVIGCGCVAISAVGGLLVIVTGSVVPALFCHASFVLFFMPRSRETSNDHTWKKMRTAGR
jgi:membrane protease YdiL (CAAX protease family)